MSKMESAWVIRDRESGEYYSEEYVHEEGAVCYEFGVVPILFGDKNWAKNQIEIWIEELEAWEKEEGNIPTEVKEVYLDNDINNLETVEIEWRIKGGE